VTKRPDTFSLGPSWVGRIFLAAAVSPLFAVGLWNVVDPTGLRWGGAAFSLVPVFIWMHLGTVRLDLTDDTLRLRRYFRTVWSVRAEDACLRSATARRAPLAPAFVVLNSQTGEFVGEIPKTQFSSESLGLLESVVPSCEA